MNESEVHVFLHQLDSSHSSSIPSSTDLFSLMKALRKFKIRRADIVMKHCPLLIKSCKDEKEVWNLHEQVFMACLDTGELVTAGSHLEALIKKFTVKSGRVLRLMGMKYEAEEKWTDAISVYNLVLEENPANIQAMKRLVAIHRSQGKLIEATTGLHKILRVFPGDMSTWIELAELHGSCGEYMNAAHCYEEVVLLEPTNPHAHTRLGDCYYSTYDITNLVTARKHYALSLEYQAAPINRRALMSLIATCKAIQSVSQSEASSAASLSKLEQSVNSEMLKWGMEQLESMTMSKEPKSEVTALIYRSLTASQGKVWELNK